MKRRKSSEEGSIKPSYSPSKIINFLRCPYSFYLSQHWEPVFGKQQLSLFAEGNLFEGYVFGFQKETEKKLIGRKHKATVEKIKAQANFIKPIFRGTPRIGNDQGKCKNAFKFETVEFETFIARGEMDYRGGLRTSILAEKLLLTDREEIEKLPEGRVIVDLKFTGDIGRVWDYKGATREDYLQAAFYPYLHWKNHGEILDFVYIVVESTYIEPIVRFIHIKMNEELLTWVEEVLYTLDQTIFWPNHASKETCLSSYGQSRCAYMEKCEYGRAVVGGLREVDLHQLTSEIVLPGATRKRPAEPIEDAIIELIN